MAFERFDLSGYRFEPAQTWGSVWLVPIVRESPVTDDLRLRAVDNQDDQVQSTYSRAEFQSYMPRAMVMDWAPDGGVLATAETQIEKKGHVTRGKLWRRRKRTQFCFLPQSLAIEGFLVQHFKGPNIAWLDYQREVRRGNLGYRGETTVPGWFLKGVEEAVRLFEFAPHQVGSALFLDGKLINCFLCPRPKDYAKLHESLLRDCYPSYLVHYGYLREGRASFSLDAERVTDPESLAVEFQRALSRTREEEALRLDGLLGRSLDSEKLHKAGPFTVERFIAELDLEGDNYCGEAITRKDGGVEYLKLYHLSRAETRRLFLLQSLSQNDWSFERTAPLVDARTAEGVALKLIACDLGYLVNKGVWGHLFPKETRWR